MPPTSVTTRRARVVGRSALLAVTAVLTACTSTVTGEGVPDVPGNGALLEVFEQAEPPEVGSCLDTARGGIGPLGPPATVDCADPHGGEIAEVVEVPEDLASEYPTEEVLDSDEWGSLLYGDEGCGDFLLPNRYLGARDRDNLLVGGHAYLPKRVGWEAGARWVACVVEYETGITEDVNAPGRMAQAMRGPDAAAYRECWFGPAAVYDVVPCSQPHEAEPTGGYASADAGAPYPADLLSQQPYLDECREDVVDYLEVDVPNGYTAGIYLPTEPEWADFPEAQCVILDSSGRRTSGSAADA